MSQFPPSMTPPMEPMLESEDTPPAWPKAVGIVSIVWGSLGIACNGCGVVSMLVMPGLMAQAVPNEPMPPQFQPSGLAVLASVLSVCVSVVLIVAGVLVMRRRELGRWLHLGYAAAALVLTIVGVAIQLQMMAAMDQFVRENPGSMWAQQQNAPGSKIGQQVGLVFGVVLGAAYPLFCLVWFGLIKRGGSMGSAVAERNPFAQG